VTGKTDNFRIFPFSDFYSGLPDKLAEGLVFICGF